MNEHILKDERNGKIGWLTLKDFVLITLILILITVVLIAIFVFHKENANCINSPLTYGVSQLSSLNKAEVYCICSSDKTGQVSIMVTKNNISNFKLPY